eukprot:jgi/Botrbrau1/3842/Bobra.0183s0067.1
MFLSPPPQAITPAMQAMFDAKIEEAQHLTGKIHAAADAVDVAQMEVDDVKTWFWWLDKERRIEVRARQKVERAAQKVLDDLVGQQEHILRDAKKALGLWSEVGVQESRLLFWRSFEAGKVFGRRQTMWDSIINLLYSEDRNLLILVLQVIFSAAVNFTFGMLVSLFVYAFQLPGLLAAFGGSFLSSLLFFLVSLLGAASVVAGFLLCLYGAGATAVYATVSLASSRVPRLTAAERRLLREQGYHDDDHED